MRTLLFRFLCRRLLTSDDVEWVVNDIAELGVRVGNRFFFLYKGSSLEYDGLHDSGEPMRWRPVYKREFGEVVKPPSVDRLVSDSSGYYKLGDGWQNLPQRTEVGR
jgi:hypothetical protein